MQLGEGQGAGVSGGRVRCWEGVPTEWGPGVTVGTFFLQGRPGPAAPSPPEPAFRGSQQEGGPQVPRRGRTCGQRTWVSGPRCWGGQGQVCSAASALSSTVAGAGGPAL